MASKSSLPSGLLIGLVVLGLVAVLRWGSIKELFVGDQFPPTAFEWEHDWKTAEAAAQEQNKPMLVVFSASWCPPCKAMKREVWPNKLVGEAVMAGYVPLYVDVDEEVHAQKVAKYQVSGIPLVAILDAEGKVKRQANYMSAEETLQFLRTPLKP